MQLKPEEISKIIRAQIKHYENVIEQSEVGTVIMVGDGIARASGLEKCMAGELLQFDNGEYGMAQNLEENTVSIVLLGSDVGIKEGSTVKRTGKVVSVGQDRSLCCILKTIIRRQSRFYWIPITVHKKRSWRHHSV